MTEKHVLTGRKHDMLGNQTFEVLQLLSKRSHQSWKVFEFVDTFLLNKYVETLNQVFLCPKVSEMR